MSEEPADTWRTYGHHYLAAQGPTDVDPFVMALGREVSEDELARVTASHRALREFWPRGRLADLSEATADVTLTRGQLDHQVRVRSGVTSDDYRGMEGSLREWLAHFSAFDQHLLPAVSQHFGRDRMKQVKDIVDAAKDRDYAYRLALALRNVTLHQGSVITDSGYTTSEDGSHELRLGVEPRKLAQRDQRADAALRATAGPISVQTLVQRGFLAAERVLLESMLAVRDDIYLHTTALEDLAHEVLGDTPDARARIVLLQPKVDESIGQIVMHDIPTEYREGYDEFYGQCAQVMNRPVPTTTPEDLVG